SPPRAHSPPETRGRFKPIRPTVPGLEITEKLPKLARLAKHFALVRSLHHNRAEHSGGTNRFLTGYSSVAANLPDSEFPDVGSVVAKQLERQRGDVPLYVGNTKFYGGGPAYLRPPSEPVTPPPHRPASTGHNVHDPVPIYLTEQSRANLSLTSEGALTLRRRHALRQSLDAFSRSLDNPATLSAFDAHQRRAVEMLAGQRTREAFDLSREPEK